MTIFSSLLSRPQGALVSDFIESLDIADGTIMGLSNMELRLDHGQRSIPEMVTSLTCKPGHWGTLRFSCRRTGKDPEWFPERNGCKTYYTGYSCPGVLWAVPCNCVIDCKWYKQSFNQQHDIGSLLPSHSSSPTSGLLPLRGLSALSIPTTPVFMLCFAQYVEPQVWLQALYWNIQPSLPKAMTNKGQKTHQIPTFAYWPTLKRWHFSATSSHPQAQTEHLINSIRT